MRIALLVVVAVGCSKSPPPSPPPPAPAPVVADSALSSDAAPPVDASPPLDAPPPIDAAMPDAAPVARPKPKPTGNLKYTSDCSLTHPVARNPCDGPPPQTNGLQSCEALHIKEGDACKAGAPRCWLPQRCGEGRIVPRDYLECVDKPSGRCLTRSSRQFKRDIEYLEADELAALAAQVEALRVARYRYKDSDEAHLGFITEDAPGAAFVTADGRRVDLYALLSASIVALQAQDARIKALEAKCTGAADAVESAHVRH